MDLTTIKQPKMKPTIVRTISLNNQAANRILQGRSADAEIVLLKSLHILRRLMKGHEDNESDDLSIPLNGSCENSRSPCTALPPSICGSVFKNPVFITEQDIAMMDGGDSSADLSKIFAIATFNLGLSHHMRGHMNLCKRELKKASSIYELSLTIKIRNKLNVGSYYRMALVNNLSEIHSVLGNRGKAAIYAQFFRKEKLRGATKEGFNTPSSRQLLRSSMECPRPIAEERV